MLHDSSPNLDPGSGSPQSPKELEPISPEEAAAILDRALAHHEAEGWHVLDRSAYSARLTRGERNLDVQVDLLGNVDARESGLTPLQDSGRLVAWVLLLAMLLVTLAVTSAIGLW